MQQKAIRNETRITFMNFSRLWMAVADLHVWVRFWVVLATGDEISRWNTLARHCKVSHGVRSTQLLGIALSWNALEPHTWAII